MTLPHLFRIFTRKSDQEAMRHAQYAMHDTAIRLAMRDRRAFTYLLRTDSGDVLSTITVESLFEVIPHA